MKTKIVIIGGGVAGLSAAIRLTELGEQPILIEGGSYPAHKVCGEFLSPECLPILHRWDIVPHRIPQILLTAGKTSLQFIFPSPAGGMSHIELDPQMAEYAAKRGATIITNTKVSTFQPKEHLTGTHQIQLSTGEKLAASQVILATGRIPGYSLQPPKMEYMGFKAHYENITTEGCLSMHSLQGAYLGIAPIGENLFNVACMAKVERIKKFGQPEAFIEHLISSNQELEKCLSPGKNLFGQWMLTNVPSFGLKETPNWPDVYFIGDAAATIPPACGDGLSMAVLGGYLAAEYAKNQQAAVFKQMWATRCASQIFWAKCLHHIMLNPAYGRHLVGLSNYFPSISQAAFALTRHSPCLFI